MIIKANNHEIAVDSVISTTIKKNGKTYPALKFVVNGAISEDDIAALSSGHITISKNKHEGYNTIGEVSVVVGKIETAEEQRDELANELSDVREKIGVILPKLDDETALSVSSLFPVWESGVSYNVDDRIVYNGVLYKVVQTHTAQNDWMPDVSSSLYSAITVSDDGHDVWKQPTGAHDAYNTGDVVSHNGTLFRSKIDGNTTEPNTESQYWEVYTS